MKKIISFTLLFVILTLSNNLAQAQMVDLGKTLMERNELFLVNQRIKPYIFSSKIKHRLMAWLNHPENNDYVVECQYNLRPFFRSDSIIGPLCYFMRQDSKKRRARYYNTIKRYYLEVKMALSEIASDPRYPVVEKQKAKKLLSYFTKQNSIKLRSCFNSVMKINWSSIMDGGRLTYSPFSRIRRCLRDNLPTIRIKDGGTLPYFSINLMREFTNHPGHVVSATGWLGGNKVEYLTKNDYSKEHLRVLKRTRNLIPKLYPLRRTRSFTYFVQKHHSEYFTPEEGFYTIENDPNWTQEGSIYSDMLKAINNAKESIFIDMFFFGGTMGVSMAKHLIHLVETKPGLKVFILRDVLNHFGFKADMEPLYNYLIAYSLKNPDKMVVAPAFIRGHRSALPPILRDVVTDKFLVMSGVQDHLKLYGRAISDHSKVFVVDGKSNNPVAFVGSKNWLDASGALCWDEVVKVEGPGAAVVMDDYYFDMFYGLYFFEIDKIQRIDNQTLRNKEINKFIRTFAKRGWSKDRYKSGQSRQEMISNILRPFDLLNRNRHGLPTKKAHVVNVKGTTVLRTGMNNVDSTRSNAIDQVLQAIMFARKNIYIKDQFLFDRNVVMALIKAKLKRPQLDVRLILDSLHQSQGNILYLDVLTDVGIRVKMKKTLRDREISQKYHMKTISVDGKYVISGSANKDQMTMYGAFREEQIDLYDTKSAKIHDDLFLQHWNSYEETTDEFSGFTFKVPERLVGFDGKPLTQEECIELVRDVISILFDQTSF